MKKTIVSLLVLLSFTFGYAQKANVGKARNIALTEDGDYDQARELIKDALNDPTTKDDARTWYTAGLIGYQQSANLYKKAFVGEQYDQNVKGKALMEAYRYFLIADSIDHLPDAKGKIKPRFGKEIKANLKDMYETSQHLLGYGAYLFDEKKYADALDAFDAFLSIPKMPMMNNEIAPDTTYYQIQYFAGYSALLLERHEKAIRLLNEAKTGTFRPELVYQVLAEEYATVKDTANYITTLEEGFKKFPAEPVFVQLLINHYFQKGDNESAARYLNSAIALEPDVPQYCFLQGFLLEQSGKMEESKAAYEKALEMKADYPDPMIGIGRLYYNRAVALLDEASNVSDTQLYNAEKTKADQTFKESLPYFEKAAELSPDDRETKMTLRSLYYRLQMDDKFNAISQELGLSTEE
ncbi:MAG: tetratricopeptide repeat protein [Prevotellaceae bacterium]|jgi:tetratricopeptide (TPR) repeat protein|nr:tetratricopeptide repeat protein [Prevotellaceae bacterium]